MVISPFADGSLVVLGAMRLVKRERRILRCSGAGLWQDLRIVTKALRKSPTEGRALTLPVASVIW